MMYLIVPASIFYIYKTRAGLILRSLGENPASLDTAGINVFALRYAYVIFGCAMIAVSGACISLSYTNFWNEGMTGGKGWIAFSLVAFSRWNPGYAALGALLFGGIGNPRDQHADLSARGPASVLQHATLYGHGYCIGYDDRQFSQEAHGRTRGVMSEIRSRRSIKE